MTRLYQVVFADVPFQFYYRSRRTGKLPDFHHYHQGIEFLYVHEGVGLIEADGATYSVRSGTFACFTPFQPHRVHIQADGIHPYISTVFKFDPVSFEPYLRVFPSLHERFIGLWNGKAGPRVLQLDGAEELENLLAGFAKLSESMSGGATEAAAVLLVSWMNALQRVRQEGEGPGSAPPPKSRGDHHVERIKRWIEGNYQKSFHLEELAADLYLSPNHASALFRRATGMTISDYLAKYRVQAACCLLKTTDLPIRDIAAEVGIVNLSYFSQLFKKNAGLPPHRYRLSL